MLIHLGFFQKFSLVVTIPAVIFLDQLSKYLVKLSSLESSCNKGIAFGIGGNAPLLSTFVLVLVATLFLFEKDLLRRLSLLAIIGGGLSNLFDRLIFGCVWDFITIGWFPAFNLADSAISAGATGLFFSLLRSYSERKNSGIHAGDEENLERRSENPGL